MKEAVGDVHGVNLIVAASNKIKKCTNGTQLGGGREGIELINTVALGEALGNIASVEHGKLTRQLLYTVDPTTTNDVDTRGGRSIYVGAIAPGLKDPPILEKREAKKNGFDILGYPKNPAPPPTGKCKSRWVL